MGRVAKGEVEINIRETCKREKFTPPHPIEATLTIAKSDSDNKCLMSFTDDDDVSITSSTKTKEIHVSNSTPVNNNPPEGKSTAIVGVMRGKPEEGYHCHSSNKH